jgi:hypothetical protein
MSLTGSFDLIEELLLLCSLSSNSEENLIKLVYDRMNDFIDGKINDECARAILNLLGKARYLYIIHQLVKVFFNFNFNLAFLQRKINANIGDYF